MSHRFVEFALHLTLLPLHLNYQFLELLHREVLKSALAVDFAILRGGCLCGCRDLAPTVSCSSTIVIIVAAIVYLLILAHFVVFE